MDFDREHDQRVRAAAFAWLNTEISDQYRVISRDVLAHGFEHGGQRVRLVGPQGIFKPAMMDLPLSITTSPNSPYDDEMGQDRLLRYRYRGQDPYHRDNVGLRVAMQSELPLVYFHGLVPGRYLAIWPVYVIEDSMRELTFIVSCEAASLTDQEPSLQDPGEPYGEPKREYVTTEVQRRIHQSAFRERVLLADGRKCAFCYLRHTELLDAAHIIPDRELRGEPVVSNGMSLCRLHHAAFDRYMLGVQPNYIIQVRSDILKEIDGPTLRHSIQGLHGQQIVLPTKRDHRPAIHGLEERWERFLQRM